MPGGMILENLRCCLICGTIGIIITIIVILTFTSISGELVLLVARRAVALGNQALNDMLRRWHPSEHLGKHVQREARKHVGQDNQIAVKLSLIAYMASSPATRVLDRERIHREYPPAAG
ncbi:hypothetical protein CAOG_009522 [Capsaspora owczarzaki ATCC 30864]|uniref:Uncharacterized protein n=1 Tax=Capsaspora owczarzaki (strain ATCC 30864) TaxID=595528 RepID=A0A0D2U7P1_CAPO3|nr:hypothetical protein CAOG_009522 [Capsaspora owczarzaki ATCC 30864]